MKLNSLPKIVLFSIIALASSGLSSCAMFKPSDSYGESSIGGNIYMAPNSAVPTSNRYLGYSATVQ